MPLAAAGQYPIWANAIIFAVAALAVWLAGTKLTRAVDEIASRTGLGRAFAGMLLLGGITALPELANCVTSAAIGNPTLAANNLLGSASINLLLLALIDAAIGRNALTSFVAGPATLMQAALSMLVLTIVAAAVVSGDVAFLGAGAWSVAICAASVGAFWMAARYERVAPWAPKDAPQATRSAHREPPGERASDGSMKRLVAVTAATAGAILVAGYSLAQTGDALAQQTGLGSGMVGFVLLGLSTSLPELSTITAALRMRRHELAIGEVLGSNFINMALFLAIDAVYAGGPVVSELGRFETASALLGVALTGVFLVGLLERRDPVLGRMGYDSLVVILLFGGGVALLFALR